MLKDIAPKGQPPAVRKARGLRREMTLPEVILWQALRKRPGGLKFRRQHPCGPFILDFFCSDARLAIEVDGEAHSRGTRPNRDDARDRRLAKVRIATLRLPAGGVLQDLDEAVQGIVETCRERLPLHHPALPGGPPPRDKLGEE